MRGLRIGPKLISGFAICVILSAIIGVVAVVNLGRIRIDTVEIGIARDIEKEVLECRKQEKNIMLFGPHGREILEEEVEKTYLEKVNDNLTALRKLVEEGKRIAEEEEEEEFNAILIEIESYEDSLKKIVADYDERKREIDAYILIMRKNGRRVQEIARKIIGIAETRIDTAHRTARGIVWTTLILAIIFGSGTAIFLSRSITNPIRKLTTTTALIAKGDLTQRVDIKSTDEIGELAQSFNKMIEDLQKITVSRDYMDNIIKSMIDTLIVVDPDASIKTINKAMSDLLGYKEEELIGRPVATIFAEEEEEEEEVSIFKGTRLKKLIEKGTIRDYDMKYRTKEGEVIPVSFSGSVMRDKEGELVGIVGIARDMREREKMEEELLASEQKFKDLTETTTDWIWEVDKDGIYTYVSPKVEELLGYEVSEVLGKTPFDFMPKEEVEKVGKIFKEKVIKKEPFYKLENVNRHKDGHLVTLETNGIPIFDEEGQLKGYRGIDRDITERKRAQEKEKELAVAVAVAKTEKKRAAELDKAYKELKEMDELKSDFIDMASHELRSPLTPVKGYIDMMKDGELGEVTPEQKEKLKIASEELNRTIALVKDMLDLSRIEAKKVELIEEELSISELGKEAVAEVSHALKEKGHELEVDIPKDLPPIMGDKVLIGKTLTNLLTNAIRHTPEGGGRITITAADEGRHIHLKISDAGIGIPKKDLEKIFDKFYQVKRGTTREPGGLGIGLAIAKSIAELHNGRIWAESKLGKGSTFHVLLPKGGK